MENKKSMPKLKRSMTAGQMEMISLGAVQLGSDYLWDLPLQ
jgi:amino acid permease